MPLEVFDGKTAHKFHHVGVACRDIELETEKLALLGYTIEGDDFTDEAQGVAGRFLSGQEPRLELLSPLAEGGVLNPWLDSGVKLYHLAYEVDDLPEAIKAYRKNKAKLVVEPVAATAYDGRRIAFLVLPNMLMIELISAT